MATTRTAQPLHWRLQAAHAGLLAWLFVLPLCRCAMAADLVVPKRSLQPQWLAGGDFWYVRELTGGERSYRLVTGNPPANVPLFDQVRLAAELDRVLGGVSDPRHLPIGNLDVERERIAFDAGGRRFTTARHALALAEVPASATTLLPIGEEIPASRDAGGPSRLVVINHSGTPLVIAWSDWSQKRHPFGDVQDGQRRVFDTTEGHAWLVSSANGRLLGAVVPSGRETVVDVGAAALEQAEAALSAQGRSPDGRWVAEVRQHNLWLSEVSKPGAAFALTTDGTELDRYETPVWSPDGTRLAAMRVRAGDRRTITLIESSPPDQVQPKVHIVPYDKPGDRIDQSRPCLFAVADRRQIPVDSARFANSWRVDSLAWRADSSGFTVLFNQRGNQVMRVIGVGRDGDVRIVLEEKAATFFDYYGKCFLGRYDQSGDLVWMSERDGWNHLYRFDLRTGEQRNRITQGPWVVRSVEHVDPVAGQVWFAASGVFPGEDPYHLHYGRVALTGGEPVWLTEGDGTHVVSWSPDRKWLVDSWSRVDLPPRHVLRDGRDGRLVLEVEHVDVDALRASGWVPPERFVAKGRDGVTDIHGVLWRPRGFDATKRYPVVEDIYTSPHSSHVPKAFWKRYRQQDLADLGFVVARIDGMGTSHRSKAFQDVCWKNLADAGFPDRIAWLKSAATQRPWMDLTRVGIVGSSAGGQSALGALLFHPEFYHVAVADCGCHDNRMDKISWNEQWMGWPLGPHYAEQSNVTHAHKLQGKLMLIVGELDDNVDPSSTFQVAHALEQAGKDFELVVIHGHGHGAVGTPFGTKKQADFLVRHLLGRQP